MKKTRRSFLRILFAVSALAMSMNFCTLPISAYTDKYTVEESAFDITDLSTGDDISAQFITVDNPNAF